MIYDKKQLVESLIKIIPDLTIGQLYWLQRVVSVFSAKYNYELIKPDIFNSTTLQNFGDAMRIHHCFSAEPFSKDKFEYVLVNVLNMSGHIAELAPKGNPGHDITMDGVRLSLKTQADRAIKPDVIWISKFMELGKGNWSNDPEDLEGLRDQFIEHTKNYDKIVSLRSFFSGSCYHYELVEIPKTVLELAKNGRLEMMMNSKQNPKPGYCHVHDKDGNPLFDLYFDGGGERKLQIKNLYKNNCFVHATWDFIIPPE